MNYLALDKYKQARNKFATGSASYFLRIIRIRFLQFLWRKRTNSPYLSGDSISELCQVVVNQSSMLSLDRQKIIEAKSIFVFGDYFNDFLSVFGESITAKVVIVGNSDVNFDKQPLLPKGVQLFLAQNAAYETSDRFGVLPIGLENLKLGRLGNPKWYRERTGFQFEDKVLVPPMSPTNKIRQQILESPLLQSEVFHVFRSYLVEKRYFELVGKYRFILALEGNGYENHRVWESLYQNSFPVMLRTPWARNIESLGLPVLLVDDMDQITTSLLRLHLDKHSNFSAEKCEVLWTAYWQAIINEKSDYSR